VGLDKLEKTSISFCRETVPANHHRTSFRVLDHFRYVKWKRNLSRSLGVEAIPVLTITISETGELVDPIQYDFQHCQLREMTAVLGCIFCSVCAASCLGEGFS